MQRWHNASKLNTGRDASDSVDWAGLESLCLNLPSPGAARRLARLVAYGHDSEMSEFALEALNQLAQIEPQTPPPLALFDTLYPAAPIHAQPAIEEICRVWGESRDTALAHLIRANRWVATAARQPLEVRLLTALLAERNDLITVEVERSPATLQLLTEQAENEADDDLAGLARQYLHQDLPFSAWPDLVLLWSGQRQPLLAELLKNQGFVPQGPPYLRTLVALQLDQLEMLAQSEASVVAPLLKCCEDADPTIQTRAQTVTGRLTDRSAIEELCRVVVEQDTALARQIAVRADYQPQEAHQRALFWFMTEQWGRYEGLDFDYRLMRTVYRTASPTLRRRIAERVRVAGRTEYLAILQNSPLENQNQARTNPGRELVVQLKILADNAEWPRLWQCVFEWPLHWAIKAVNELRAERLAARRPWGTGLF